MKLLIVLTYVVVLNLSGSEALTLGGRFPRETESVDTTNKSAELQPNNNTQDVSPSDPSTIGSIPLKLDSGDSVVEAVNVTDSEADKFIESLKKQADGIEPKNKNETHVSSGDAPNITDTNNSSSISVIPLNATSVLGDVAPQVTTEPHMFQNENMTTSLPASNNATHGNDTTTTTTNMLNGNNTENMMNNSCPSDCSPDSCKPECSFHCCLKEKSSSANDSMAGFYQQDDKGKMTGGIAFDSSKLERMLLDTISEFSQKLPNAQQAQKLSEIMGDPSNHYAYAPSYDTSSNRYNFMDQTPNGYFPRDSNAYLNGAYSNKYNYPNPYGYNVNQNYAQKSQIQQQPSYSYKRNKIAYPNYPIASTHHGYARNGANMAAPQAFLYHPNNNNNQQYKKLYRRARIYSPYKSSYQV